MPLRLPPPGERRYQARDRRYTIHLDHIAEAALIELARSRGERPGQVATRLVEAAMSALTQERMADPAEVAP